MPSDRLSGVALVTGGGRGIGASIARELADAGMRVAVTGRTQEQVEAVAEEIGGLALVGDVSRPDDVEAWVGDDRAGARTDRPSRRERRHRKPDGHDLGDAGGRLVAHLRGERPRRASELPRRHPRDARARSRPHRDHRERCRVPARQRQTAYAASKAAVCRYGETLAGSSRVASRSSSSALGSCGPT